MIDLNRGCTIRIHPAGYRICMYKDAPGTYYDAKGNPIGDEAARQAGFDIERMAREKVKRERLADARSRIEREFAEQEATAEELINASVEGATFEVRHVGGGRFAIFDQDGKRVTSKGLGRDEAQQLLNDMSLPQTAGKPKEGKDGAS